MARPKPWLKMWAEWIHDRKILKLTLAERGAWWSLVNLAHECAKQGKLVNGGGRPLTIQEIADALHFKPEEIETLKSMIAKMKEEDSIDENGTLLTITHYLDRQTLAPSDTKEAVRKRVALYRKRHPVTEKALPISPPKDNTLNTNITLGRERDSVTALHPEPEGEPVTESGVTLPRSTNVTSPLHEATANDKSVIKSNGKSVTEKLVAELIKLQEENIGMMTPLLLDDFKDFAANYKGPVEWLKEAFTEACRQEKRRWKYIKAILESWQKEGKHGKGQPGKDTRFFGSGAGYTKPEKFRKDYQDRVAADGAGHPGSGSTEG